MCHESRGHSHRTPRTVRGALVYREPYGRGVGSSITSLTSAAAGQALRLPPPLTRDVRVRRGFSIRARDGAILRTDHYAPALDGAPTVLVRTPYGRGNVYGLAARVLAERGFHVIVSSCRGTSGSTGEFDPL